MLNIRLNACCVGERICQSTTKHSQMLKASLHIIPSRIEKRCMLVLINEELGAEFPLRRLGIVDEEEEEVGSTTLQTPSH